jgi:hypothetical protein
LAPRLLTFPVVELVAIAASRLEEFIVLPQVGYWPFQGWIKEWKFAMQRMWHSIMPGQKRLSYGKVSVDQGIVCCLINDHLS